MKANEAPEKIILSADRDTKIIYDEWVTKDLTDSIKIEYTRTDAFIEKALAYLCNKFYFNNVFYGIVSTDFNAMEEMYEDFRNYMKGE